MSSRGSVGTHASFFCEHAKMCTAVRDPVSFCLAQVPFGSNSVWLKVFVAQILARSKSCGAGGDPYSN
jgi:hypothetical protein